MELTSSKLLLAVYTGDSCGNSCVSSLVSSELTTEVVFSHHLWHHFCHCDIPAYTDCSGGKFMFRKLTRIERKYATMLKLA